MTSILESADKNLCSTLGWVENQGGIISFPTSCTKSYVNDLLTLKISFFLALIKMSSSQKNGCFKIKINFCYYVTLLQ